MTDRHREGTSYTFSRPKVFLLDNVSGPLQQAARQPGTQVDEGCTTQALTRIPLRYISQAAQQDRNNSTRYETLPPKHTAVEVSLSLESGLVWIYYGLWDVPTILQAGTAAKH